MPGALLKGPGEVPEHLPGFYCPMSGSRKNSFGHSSQFGHWQLRGHIPSAPLPNWDLVHWYHSKMYQTLTVVIVDGTTGLVGRPQHDEDEDVFCLLSIHRVDAKGGSGWGMAAARQTEVTREQEDAWGDGGNEGE